MSMVDTTDKEVPVSTQANLLSVNRTTLYYKATEIKEEDLKLNRLIDEIYTKYPFYGYRRIRSHLKEYNGICVNHKTVYSRMVQMGIQAIYPKKNLSKASPENKVYPYLLKGLKINKPNQVWSIDISYIPIRKSFLYLTAIIDWHSRYVIAYEIDDTLEIRFVLNTCKEALLKSKPEIMNSDQGSHFTSSKYTELFEEKNCKISMDHRGRAYDNIFIERLWRSVKYENVYLQDYATPREARQGLDEYFKFYNNERLHQSLNYSTPAKVYFS